MESLIDAYKWTAEYFELGTENLLVSPVWL